MKRDRADVDADVEKIRDWWFGRRLHYRFGAVIVINECEEPLLRVIANDCGDIQATRDLVAGTPHVWNTPLQWPRLTMSNGLLAGAKRGLGAGVPCAWRPGRVPAICRVPRTSSRGSEDRLQLRTLIIRLHKN